MLVHSLIVLFLLCLCGTSTESEAGSGRSIYSHLRIEEHVDAIELNHVYDDDGQLRMDQVLFLERYAETGRFHVRAWTLADDREVYNRRPVFDYTNDLWTCDWYDKDQKILRHITTRILSETWTSTDREKEDKKYIGEEYRYALGKNPERFEKSVYLQRYGEPKN